MVALLFGAAPIVVQALAACGVGWVVGGIGGDACTILGVPALWPWRPEKKHLVPPRWRVVTGSWREVKVVRPLLVLLAVVALLVGE
jgi:hypothetical protein